MIHHRDDQELSEPGPLDMSEAEAERLLAIATELVLRHAAEIDAGPVAPTEPQAAPVRIRNWLTGYDFAAPRSAAEVLPEVTAVLRRWTVHPTHPRYLGLFNPTPTWPGVAGELIAAAVNPQLAAYSHAPAAVEIERHVLAFLADRLGLPVDTEGSFTTGGAEANLTAVVVALTRKFPAYADAGVGLLPGRPVLYASAESHLAWWKIAHLTGLGRDAVRLVPVDKRHRMDLTELRRRHDADRAAGRLPFLLVATAGTTGGGAIDPLDRLADLAASWDLHLHVDAAWAGAAALSNRLRPLLTGVHRADSVTVDAHKWLSAPMGAGMFLTRHPRALPDSFTVRTAYMPPDATEAADPYRTSVQWSRRFAGLKAFLGLAIAGRSGYATQLERDVALGELLADRLTGRGWQRVNDTPLPVVCVVDPAADRLGTDRSAAWHQAVADQVVNGGAAWLSTVRLAGRPALRLCLTSHRTRAGHLDAVIAALDAAREAVPLNPDAPA